MRLIKCGALWCHPTNKTARESPSQYEISELSNIILKRPYLAPDDASPIARFLKEVMRKSIVKCAIRQVTFLMNGLVAFTGCNLMRLR